MPAMHGVHHITMVSSNARRTVAFFTELLGLSVVKRTVNLDPPHDYRLYFGDAAGSPGTLVTFFEWPSAGPGRAGWGGVHHLSLGVSDEEALLKWKRRLTDAGVPVSGPFDRGYFTSIYFRDPDGQVLEIATEGPGFSVDEHPERLGRSLQLPSWLEGQREQISSALVPLEVGNT
ncbi:hypothetical protein BH23GEM6_BH23GEM6_23450 [soil metagenome]